MLNNKNKNKNNNKNNNKRTTNEKREREREREACMCKGIMSCNKSDGGEYIYRALKKYKSFTTKCNIFNKKIRDHKA